MKVFAALIQLIIAGAFLIWLFSGGPEQKVATDFEQQYRISKQSGDQMSVCVQAQLVAQGYLQAKEQEKYLQWKKVERLECRAAGLDK